MFTNCLKIFRHQGILLVCNVYIDLKYTILLIFVCYCVFVLYGSIGGGHGRDTRIRNARVVR